MANPELVHDRPVLITAAELRRRVPYSASHLWRLEQRGLFPKRIALGPRRSVWNLSEIDEWVANRIKAPHKIRSPNPKADRTTQQTAAD